MFHEAHNNATITQFRAYLSWWHTLYGRRHLPWRQTSDPYHILVSELMLQQTQVDRVIPKFELFMQRFPDVETLASASLADVLSQWQGLGYNRRALFLHQAAQAVLEKYAGMFPVDEQLLRTLPGIGPYTASALMAFAFNQPTVMIETNIRSVYLYHFFPGREAVPDTEIVPLIRSTLDREHPRHFYAALMDYGSVIKKLLPNPSRRSKHHTKQSTFQGSDRQIRGQIIKYLVEHTQANSREMSQMLKPLTEDQTRISLIVSQLIQEQLVTKIQDRYRLT